MKYLFVTIAYFITLAPIVAQSSVNWSFDDAHSNLQFSVTNLMVAEVEGSIQIREATLRHFSEDFTKANIFLKGDMATIDTDNDARDEHLRSPDFFDVAKYPDVQFQSRTITRTGNGEYSVTGDLTFHGITKAATMDVTVTEAIRPYDNKAIIGFKATGVIRRSDFDIAASTPEAILSDEVQVKGNLIFVKE